jgi:hypothetical protein
MPVSGDSAKRCRDCEIAWRQQGEVGQLFASPAALLAAAERGELDVSDVAELMCSG